MKDLFLMSLLMVLSTLCSSSKSVIYKDKELEIVAIGGWQSPQFGHDDAKLLCEYVIELVEGVDDQYKQIVNNSIVKELMRNNQGVEINFHKELQLYIKNGSILVFDRIFIPYTSATTRGNSVSFYCGRKKYMTPSFVNSNGSKVINKIETLMRRK